MLAKPLKLKKSDEVKAVLAKGKKFRTENLTVFYLQNDEGFRAAVVVGKKSGATGVVRNRIRRVLFNQLSLAHQALGDKLQGGMVVMVAASAENEAALRDQLKQCLEKLLPA